MKKILFALFAHPDDEAFGPSGTLLSETRAGTVLHLILLTNGDAGTNPDNHKDLGVVRLKEWQAAGQLMGASSMHHLGYKDGQLTNQSMIDISQRVSEIITTLIATAPDDAQIELLTNDLNGITGHIDHIVAARAACRVFYQMKQRDKRFRRIRLSCLSHHDVPTVDTEWLYMEAGRTPEEINETVDNRHLREEITAIIRTHHTQRHDGDYCIAWHGTQLGMDHFIVKT
jgi:LmbE family N-acetylglucosaminyl deacetylase